MLEVAVLGGGLVGASLAYRLACHGAQVTVFDRADAGQATAAGAGILPPLDHFIGVEAVLPLLRAARQHYPELLRVLAEDGELDTGYAVVGALQVASNDLELAELVHLERECVARRDAGFAHIGELSLLDGPGARQHFPLLSQTVRGALFATGAARIDARRLLAALRRALQKRGGRWHSASAEVALTGDRVEGLRSGGRLWPADAVVIAAGAWSAPLGERLGLPLLARPQRGQLVHLELPHTDTSRWPIVLGFGTHYLLSFPPNRIVAGATREDSSGYDASVTAGAIHAVLESALRLAPGLARARLSELRAGLRPLSPDGKPILGASALHPNLYLATGHGGYGLEVGPYSGALVADLIVGKPPALDLSPFALSRFQEPGGTLRI